MLSWLLGVFLSALLGALLGYLLSFPIKTLMSRADGSHSTPLAPDGAVGAKNEEQGAVVFIIGNLFEIIKLKRNAA